MSDITTIGQDKHELDIKAAHIRGLREAQQIVCRRCGNGDPLWRTKYRINSPTLGSDFVHLDEFDNSQHFCDAEDIVTRIHALENELGPVDDNYEWYICTVENVPNNNESLSNANLLAAAPDMYRALQDIVQEYEATQMNLPVDLADSIRVLGKKALRKARSEE